MASMTPSGFASLPVPIIRAAPARAKHREQILRAVTFSFRNTTDPIMTSAGYVYTDISKSTEQQKGENLFLRRQGKCPDEY